MIIVNKFFNSNLLEFKKMEKAIQKAKVIDRIEDVEKLKKELKDLTHESFLEKFIKGSIMYWEQKLTLFLKSITM